MFHLLLRALGHLALRPRWFGLLGSGCGEFDPRDEKDHLSIIILSSSQYLYYHHHNMIRWEGSYRQGGDVGHDPCQGGDPRVVVPLIGRLCHMQCSTQWSSINSENVIFAHMM